MTAYFEVKHPSAFLGGIVGDILTLDAVTMTSRESIDLLANQVAPVVDYTGATTKAKLEIRIPTQVDGYLKIENANIYNDYLVTGKSKTYDIKA